MFCRKVELNRLNNKMDKLLLVMKSEKDLVNHYIGKDWKMVEFYGKRASTTMRALRKINKMIKLLN